MDVAGSTDRPWENYLKEAQKDKDTKVFIVTVKQVAGTKETTTKVAEVAKDAVVTHEASRHVAQSPRASHKFESASDFYSSSSGSSFYQWPR